MGANMAVDKTLVENSNTSSRGLFWLFFRLPGAVLLWIQYYFPSNGRVLVSARQRGNPIMEFIFSIGFWGFLIFLALIMTGTLK
jgi:hypothetical protein